MVVRDRTARILTLAFLFFYALFLHRLLTKYRGIRQASTEDQDFEVQGWERGVSRRAGKDKRGKKSEGKTVSFCAFNRRLSGSGSHFRSLVGETVSER